ncbi:MAG TPA: helix-turn-helix domain-containing protein [Solirubrobacterales bacterium]|nr:helix-turn-helix domain-containing protein [Solirubrobacterales bacterium]
MPDRREAIGPVLSPVDRFQSEATAAEFDRLVAELESRLDFLAAEGLEAMRGRVPRWILETGPVWQQLGECIRGTLRTEWAAFRDGFLPGRLPDIDATLIVMAARVGDLSSLLAGYRFAQMALWGSWFELIEASVTDETVKRELLRHGSQYFFQYADLVSRYMAEGYQRGVERAAAQGEHHRFQAIKSLLEADPLSGSHFDIDLNHYHLGCVAWGEGADEAVRQLGTGLGRPVQLTLRLHNNWWGWISGSRPLDPRQEAELSRFEPGPGIRIAFGLEGFGEAGLRATNHQALRAQWVAPPGPAVIHYEDVAVETLATEAESDARAFVAHELHGIDDPSAASARLRETLAAYFAAELNAASAGAALGVHHQTVTNRLRVIEERIGHSLGARHLELAVALRLRAALSREEI